MREGPRIVIAKRPGSALRGHRWRCAFLLSVCVCVTRAVHSEAARPNGPGQKGQSHSGAFAALLEHYELIYDRTIASGCPKGGSVRRVRFPSSEGATGGLFRRFSFFAPSSVCLS